MWNFLRARQHHTSVSRKLVHSYLGTAGHCEDIHRGSLGAVIIKASGFKLMNDSSCSLTC